MVSSDKISENIMNVFNQRKDTSYSDDKSPDNINILKELGSPECLEQLAEEGAELTKAALKLARVIRGNNPTPVTFEEAYRNLIEEITDVAITCDVLYLNKDQDMYDSKIKRWKQRLADHYTTASDDNK